MNVSAVATPLSLQTGAAPEAAPGEAPSGEAAPASSFDAMLAAVPAQGASSPHAKTPPAARKGEREGEETPADPATPDSSPQIVVLAAPVVLPTPALPAGPAGSESARRASPVPAEGARAQASVGTAPAIPAQAAAASAAPAATPAPAQGDAAVLSGLEATQPPAPDAGSAPRLTAAASPSAPASAAQAASALPTLPDGAGIDLDALFPRGGDKPLHVTFPSAAAASATAGPVGAAAALTPSAAALAQAVAAAAKPAPPAAKQPDAVSGVSASATGDKGDAAAASLPAAAPAAPPVAIAAPSAPAVDAASASLGAAQTPAAGVVLQHHIDLAQDSAWLDGLARDIARSAAGADGTGGGMLNFRISPRHMGDVQVALATGAEGTAIRMTADTPAAHALLTDSRHVLVAQAEAHGMRVSEARIDLASNAGQASSGGLSGGAPGGSGGQGAAPEPRGNLLTMLPQRGRRGDEAAPSLPRRERYA